MENLWASKTKSDRTKSYQVSQIKALSIFNSQSADFSNLETFQTFRLKFAPKSNHNFVSNKPYHADKIKNNLNHDFCEILFWRFFYRLRWKLSTMEKLHLGRCTDIFRWLLRYSSRYLSIYLSRWCSNQILTNSFARDCTAPSFLRPLNSLSSTQPSMKLT